MTRAYFLQLLSDHKEGLMLFAMALIVTMRKELPWPFNRVEALEWSYEWLRDALLTLLSLKGATPHAELKASESKVTDAAGNVTSEKKTSATIEPVTAESKTNA